MIRYFFQLSDLPVVLYSDTDIEAILKANNLMDILRGNRYMDMIMIERKLLEEETN